MGRCHGYGSHKYRATRTSETVAYCVRCGHRHADAIRNGWVKADAPRRIMTTSSGDPDVGVRFELAGQSYVVTGHHVVTRVYFAKVGEPREVRSMNDGDWRRLLRRFELKLLPMEP